MTRPLVSVVIPTHNRWHLLQRTLRTVLGQEGVDVEAVVVDDGSTDGTTQRLATLADPRILAVRHATSRGVAQARNTGISRASAPWIAFVDDDDVWSPKKLNSQLRALGQAPSTAWACTGAVLVDGNLAVIGPQQAPSETDVADLLLSRNVVPGGASGVLAAASLVREVGGFDTSLSTMADYDLWIRLALKSPLAAVRHPLVGYVVHPGGMAHDVTLAQGDLARMVDKYREVRAARGVAVDEAFWLWYFGLLHLRSGRRWQAATCHARLAWTHGQHRRWPLVAVGLAWPGVQYVRDRKERLFVPQAWKQEVEGWLGPLRSV